MNLNKLGMHWEMITRVKPGEKRLRKLKEQDMDSSSQTREQECDKKQVGVQKQVRWKCKSHKK